ncbi:response regulator [Nereida sp. MMG024]|nr:response regulator [Nereida sp. MMG025]
MQAKVLLIEDEPNISEALTFVLARDGHDVRTHSDGLTALDAIKDYGPDIIVLDVMLPNRSGFDILADLRASDFAPQTPVLMLTARGQKKDRDMAIDAGASRFMTKPFANDDVRQAINALLRQTGNHA